MQGWKIHVSACLDDADAVLDAVVGLLRTAGSRSSSCARMPALWLRNSKYASARLQRQARHHLPRGRGAVRADSHGARRHSRRASRGPYILSDLRWGDGPLYVRYGGFTERYCSPRAARSCWPSPTRPAAGTGPRATPSSRLPPWVGCPRSSPAPGRPQRRHRRRPAVPIDRGSALLQRRRGVPRRIPRTGERGRAQGGAPDAGLDARRRRRQPGCDRERTLARLAGLTAYPGRVATASPWATTISWSMEFVDGVPLHTVSWSAGTR